MMSLTLVIFLVESQSAAWCCAGTASSSSQASDQTQLNGAVTSKPQKGGAPKAKKEEARPIDLSLLSLKVGVIRKAERHPDADTLYVEEVDCGEEQPRTVLPLLLLAGFACKNLWRSCVGHPAHVGDCECPAGTSSYAHQALHMDIVDQVLHKQVFAIISTEAPRKGLSAHRHLFS